VDVLKILSLAGVTLAVAFALAIRSASAQGPSLTVITPPFYQPGAGAQIGGSPYQGRGFTIYPPGSATLPAQLNGRAGSAYPPGARTCVAAAYACPADSPNTVGNSCACAIKDGGSIPGVVR
jgi:hypothetical protein